MKAIVYKTYSKAKGPDVLEVTELPIPEPGPGQLLVRVRAAGVNALDWKIAAGELWPIFRPSFPQVPGTEFAGVVERCGDGVTGFDAGARVHAWDPAVAAASAEYTLATASLTAPLPESMDFATAAGLPIAGMTALQALRNLGGMPLEGATQRVMIVGASGGVGTIAVQIARSAGATVVGVCSGRNRQLVESLGAHEIIDYTAEDPYKGFEPCDIIFDTVGKEWAGTWLARLKAGGRYITVLPGPAIMLRKLLNPLTSKKSYAIMCESNAADLRTVDDLAAVGKLRVMGDKRFPLEDLKSAWEFSITGRAVGKIVLEVGEEK